MADYGPIRANAPYSDDLLARWEAHWLDRDGGTERICASIKVAEDIFGNMFGDAGIRSMGIWHRRGTLLLLRGMRLMNWEFWNLDGPAGGTNKRRRGLSDARIFFLVV